MSPDCAPVVALAKHVGGLANKAVVHSNAWRPFCRNRWCTRCNGSSNIGPRLPANFMHMKLNAIAFLFESWSFWQLVYCQCSSIARPYLNKPYMNESLWRSVILTPVLGHEASPTYNHRLVMTKGLYLQKNNQLFSKWIVSSTGHLDDL